MTNNLFDKKLCDLTDEEVWEYVPEMNYLKDEGMSIDEAWEYIDDACRDLGLDFWNVTLREYTIKYNNSFSGTTPPKKSDIKPKRKGLRPQDQRSKDDFNYLKPVKWKTALMAKDDSELLRLRIANDKLKKKNDELKKKLKDLLKNEVDDRVNYRHYMNAIDGLGGEGDEFVEEDKTPYQKHMDEINNYRQWKEANNNDSQNELVKERWATFMRNPFKSEFEFKGLTNEGRRMAFPLLKKWLTNVVGKVSARRRFDLKFRVDGKWRTAKLTPEKWRELNEKFTEESLLYSIDKNYDNVHFSDDKIPDLPDWSLFDAIRLQEVKGKGNEEVGAAFFKFLNNTDIDLTRYQIFDEIGEMVINDNGYDHFKQRKELNDCCFVYALQQSGKISEEELNSIRLRIRNRNLSQTQMRTICEEFEICARVRQFKGLNFAE